MIQLQVRLERRWRPGLASAPEAEARARDLLRQVKAIKAIKVPVSLGGEGVEMTGEDEARVWLVLSKDRFQDANVVRRQFEEAAGRVAVVARQMGWAVVGTWVEYQGERKRVQFDLPPEDEGGQVRTPVEVDLPALTPEVMSTVFARHYNRERHIRRVYDAMRRAAETKFESRPHVLLWGPPSCDKTELLLSFASWLGEDTVWRLDASTTSKAGLETELLRKARQGVMPPFVVCEEVEKAPEANYSVLLQVMDSRGKVQRTNARGGDQWAWCRPLMLLTCNDAERLRDYLDGALWSRCVGTRVYCGRPDRATMLRILLDKAADPRHAEAAVAFMYDVLAKSPGFAGDYDDPRLGEGLLAAGDRLLDFGPDGAMQDFLLTAGGVERPRGVPP